MRILDFGPMSGHAISAFDSNATLTPLMGQTDSGKVAVVIEGEFQVGIPEQ